MVDVHAKLPGLGVQRLNSGMLIAGFEPNSERRFAESPAPRERLSVLAWVRNFPCFFRRPVLFLIFGGPTLARFALTLRVSFLPSKDSPKRGLAVLGAAFAALRSICLWVSQSYGQRPLAKTLNAISVGGVALRAAASLAQMAVEGSLLDRLIEKVELMARHWMSPHLMARRPVFAARGRHSFLGESLSHCNEIAA